MIMKKAIFIDKDGTLITNVPYNVDVNKIQLVNDVGPSLLRLSQHGYLFVVITNQSGIAKGLFTEEQLSPVFQTIQALLDAFHVTLAGFYYCPHHPQGTISSYTKTCFCRKPLPGLLFQAASDLHIDISSSWMIGDMLTDVETGNKAGCKTILLHNSNDIEEDISPHNIPYYIAPTFRDIVDAILLSEK